MSEEERPGAGLVERLVTRLDALERENATLRAEMAGLSRELSEDPARVSRRGALRLGAAAVAGAAATAGGLVGAQPALAGSDGDLALGSSSNSAGAPTGLSVSGTTSKYGIGVTDNGLGVYPNTTPSGALFGHAHNANFQSGVVGYSDSGMSGVVGRSDPIDSTG